MVDIRQEIRDTQTARSDLFKWKLIISAALGALGLGIKSSESSPYSSNVDLAFCLIPFVCAYVDLLCYHLNLRIFVINKFFNRFKIDENQVNDWKEIYLLHLYEKTCHQVRDAFELESWVLKWSSIFISVGIIILIFLAQNRTDAYLFLSAGVLGVLMAIISETVYEHKVTDLESIELSKIELQKKYFNSIKLFESSENGNEHLKPLRHLEWIKRFSLVLLTSFSLVGVLLVNINISKYPIKEPSHITDTPKDMILPGILFILAATLIEYFYRRIIDWQKEKIEQLSKTNPAEFKKLFPSKKGFPWWWWLDEWFQRFPEWLCEEQKSCFFSAIITIAGIICLHLYTLDKISKKCSETILIYLDNWIYFDIILLVISVILISKAYERSCQIIRKPRPSRAPP